MRKDEVPSEGLAPVAWSDLAGPARAFRVAHAAWGVAGLAALGTVWAAVLTGRRDRWLAASLAFLGLEGVALVIGRGDCPLGPFQRRLGDPIPLFELVLPPRAAKLAIPVLLVASLAGMVALMLPRGQGRSRATDPRTTVEQRWPGHVRRTDRFQVE